MKFKWSKVSDYFDVHPEKVTTKERNEEARLTEVWARLERIGKSIQEIADKEKKKDTSAN